MQRGFAVMALALLAARAAPAGAQTIGPWDDPARVGIVSFDLQKPAFENEGFDATTGLAFLTTRWTAVAGVTLVVELPFEHAGVDDLFGEPVSASMFGNPYVGIETVLGGTGVFAELGFRPPIASDPGDAGERLVTALTAGFADYDRIEAFLYDVWSVRARLGYRWRSAAGVTLGGAVGPTLMFGGGESFLSNESSFEGEGTDTALDYRLDLGYDASRFRVGTAFTGRLLLGEPGAILAFVGDAAHQLAFGAGVTLGKARPAIFMRFPVDRDLSSAVRFTFGLGVSVRP